MIKNIDSNIKFKKGKNKKKIITPNRISVDGWKKKALIITLIVTSFWGCMGILESWRKENNEKSGIIAALTLELGLNEIWVNEVIDYNNGAHKGSNLNEAIMQYSWTDNPPQFSAYKNFLKKMDVGINAELTEKIIKLYSRLKQCEVILARVQKSVNDKAVEQVLDDNNRIYKICLGIREDFDFNEIIRQLNSIIGKNSFYEAPIIDKSGLQVSGSGVGERTIIVEENKQLNSGNSGDTIIIRIPQNSADTQNSGTADKADKTLNVTRIK